jgi:hypothetical protein
VENINMGARVWKKSSQPKIGNLGIKMFVQQNIGCFDISMYNAGLSIFMKIGETTNNSETFFFCIGQSTLCLPLFSILEGEKPQELYHPI